MANPPTLHFLCGKLACGKTTLAQQLTQTYHAVFISEDIWLSRLFPEEISDFHDYLKYSSRFRSAIAPHIIDLLRHGMSVVLDFAGNVPQERQWVRSMFESAQANHTLHYIIASDALCKAQLRLRNQMQPEGSKVTTEAEFDQITQYFIPPGVDEAFQVKEYHPDYPNR